MNSGIDQCLIELNSGVDHKGDPSPLMVVGTCVVGCNSTAEMMSRMVAGKQAVWDLFPAAVFPFASSADRHLLLSPTPHSTIVFYPPIRFPASRCVSLQRVQRPRQPQHPQPRQLCPRTIKATVRTGSQPVPAGLILHSNGAQIGNLLTMQ